MDEERRRALHERLDGILSKRSQIEPPFTAKTLGALLGESLDHAGEIEPGDRPMATGLLFDTIALAHDLLGEPILRAAVRRAYSRESEQRHLLRDWLRIMHPLLQPWPSLSRPSHEKELSLFEVLDALSALDAGEIRPIFAANTGKNRRANRWSLAAAKLEALGWKKRLRALGFHEKAANYEVTMAFGEQWDTIRKWKNQCEQTLGESHVFAALEFAGSEFDAYLRKPSGGFFGSRRPLDAAAGLKAAGDQYKHELRRSAELSKRKRAPREA